jgi:hypothetical protein
MLSWQSLSWTWPWPLLQQLSPRSVQDNEYSIHGSSKGPAFLTSFFALVVFLVDGFFTVAAFFEVAGAFFGAAVDILAGAFAFDTLVLLAAAFFAGVGLDDSVAFFVDVPFLDRGFVFCDRLSHVQREGAIAIYLLSIGWSSRTLRSKLDLA